jgi:hypothetical protein
MYPIRLQSCKLICVYRKTAQYVIFILSKGKPTIDGERTKHESEQDYVIVHTKKLTGPDQMMFKNFKINNVYYTRINKNNEVRLTVNSYMSHTSKSKIRTVPKILLQQFKHNYCNNFLSFPT